jgi:hypothetical protein
LPSGEPIFAILEIRSDNLPADCAVNILAAAAGVATGFGVAPGANHCHSEGDQGVAQQSAFSRTQHKVHLGKSDAKSTNKLAEFAVSHGEARSKFSSGGAEPWQADADLRLPAPFEQVLNMGGESNGVLLPGGQTEESTDSQPFESGFVATLRAIESPIKVAFGPSGMEFAV